MQGWQPDAAPGFGWPLGERTWINPSPNAPNLWMARAYAGTVMVEGTTLSEGRGTTRPLELFGAPDIERADAVLHACTLWRRTGSQGCRLRECWFEPTFHKHAGTLCNGIADPHRRPGYDHAAFRPWRILALAFKAIRHLIRRLSALARLCLRVRARQTCDRRHQRRAVAARVGRRSAGDAGRLRRAGAAGRGSLAERARGVFCVY